MTPSLLSVLALIAIGWVGAGPLGAAPVFGIALPYAALLAFILGFLVRMTRWASAPVPFHIPTVCGQQRSLPWIKSDPLGSPFSKTGVFARMALEVLFFRSLWSNDRMELKRADKLVYGSNRYLWASGLLFHWSLLVILLRHLRLFTDPALPGIGSLESLDGFFQLGIPAFYISDLMIMAALAFLFARRAFSKRLRAISLPSDYFALFLISAVVVSGVLMRYVFKTDVERVKELTLGILSFRPVVPEGIGTPFYVHLFLVSVLLAYFPWSKLMHAPGVFLSPTRNLMNDSRARRHVNPWGYPVKVHTYEEYETEFREAMESSGIPLDKGTKNG